MQHIIAIVIAIILSGLFLSAPFINFNTDKMLSKEIMTEFILKDMTIGNAISSYYDEQKEYPLTKDALNDYGYSELNNHFNVTYTNDAGKIYYCITPIHDFILKSEEYYNKIKEVKISQSYLSATCGLYTEQAYNGTSFTYTVKIR